MASPFNNYLANEIIVHNSGKTTAALHCIAEAQRLGKICMFVDAEKTYLSSWAEKCGVDLDALKYIRGNSVEDIAETLLPDIEGGEVDLIVIDSLSSVFLDSWLDKGENTAMGIGARSANFLIAKILNVMGLQTNVIIIAHGTMAQSGQNMILSAAVSKRVEHWSSTIFKFFKSSSKDNIREDGSVKITWKLEKSKQSYYPRDGEYWFNPLNGSIDSYAELANLAIDRELVEKKGAWFYYGDNKWHGEDNFALALKENEALYNTLEGLL